MHQIENTSDGPQPSGHSDAFGRFYADEDDLAGALAYAFYKQQKREFILRNSLLYDDYRVREYHCDLNEARIKQLRELATVKLKAYSSKIAESVEDEIRQDVAEGVIVDELKKHEAALNEVYERQQKEFTELKALVTATEKQVVSGTNMWKAVITGVVSSFVFGLVLTAARIVDWTNPFAFTSSSQSSVEAQKTGASSPGSGKPASSPGI